MIDYEASAKLHTTTVDELKTWFDKYPSSGKMVVAICDICGEVRHLRFVDYKPLCLKCVRNTPKYRKKLSDSANKRCSSQESRNEMSEILLQWNKDHPEAGKAHSEWLIQYHIDHPEYGKLLSQVRLNSDAAKAEAKRQLGGLDFCWHHVAYDFLRSDALRVRITRKQHSSIHHPKGIQLTERGYSLID